MRKVFDIQIKFNGELRRPIIVDSHFKESHPDMSYELIVQLVKQLDGGEYKPEAEKDGWTYYVIDPAIYENKPYRLILVTPSDGEYLGVVNAFRVKRKKQW